MIAELIRAFVEAVVVRGMVGAYPLPTGWNGRLRMTYAGDVVLESGAAPGYVRAGAWGRP